MRASLRVFQILQFFTLILVLSTVNLLAEPEREDVFTAIPGLIDLRSTYSDGSHTIEELAKMARSRGLEYFLSMITTR